TRRARPDQVESRKTKSAIEEVAGAKPSAEARVETVAEPSVSKGVEVAGLVDSAAIVPKEQTPEADAGKPEAESVPSSPADAARRLSFVHDREATPHLIGALYDPAPDVRRAAVEALMDLRDPAAIGPLNSLMQTENDRKVSRTLIKHAIEACATSGPSVVP